MKAMVVLWALAAPLGAWAGVDNLGTMIRDGYKEQAASYRDFQKALRGEVSGRDEAKARDLESMGEETGGADMGVRLVSTQNSKDN